MVYYNTSWPMTPKPFAMIEFFSGIGNVGKSARYGHWSTAQLDIDMGVTIARPSKQNAFDLASPAGLSRLVCVKCLWLELLGWPSGCCSMLSGGALVSVL